jgi:phenylacetate-CoA ligase
VKPEDIKDCKDICKIPVTTKSQLQNAREEAIAKDIDRYIERKTSGSTGIRTSLYFSMEDFLYNRGTYERARSENGFRILRDTLLIIGNPHTIPIKRKWHEYFGIRRRKGLNVFEPLDVQIQFLIKAKLDALWGYPSAIKLLAKVIKEEKINSISPRLIFTASELLDPGTRYFINSVFNINLFDVYGAEEGGCMAWECSEHAGYHMNMDTVLMEFVDGNGNNVDAGERGKVVITNLHSFARPIIRYELGDFAIPTYEECSCGRPGYLIKAIEGRCDDSIKLSDNQLISPRILVPIIESIPGVSAFQLVQEKVNEIVVYIVKMDECGDIVIAEEIDRGFKKVLGNNIFVNTKFVEGIPRAPSGKLKSVISKL